MGYIQYPTVDQKQEWKTQMQQTESHMKQLIFDVASSYQDSASDIAELFAFGSQFYKYSVKNNMLIYAQNKGATFVQSYVAWKKLHCTIQKGEKGIKIFVPTTTTFLKIKEQWVALSQATKAEQASYHAGELQGMTKCTFKIGTVFDIAQTTFPKESYPKGYGVGYPSEQQQCLVKGLATYAKNVLGCKVSFSNLKSIGIRGSFCPDTNEIQINELLEDSQQLSTLVHELGHAFMHQQTKKNEHQIEFEADGFGIMLASHFGIPLTESTKRHCAEHWQDYLQEQHNPTVRIDQILEPVFQTYRGCIEEIVRVVESKEPWIAIPQKEPVKKVVKKESR